MKYKTSQFLIILSVILLALNSLPVSGQTMITEAEIQRRLNQHIQHRQSPLKYTGKKLDWAVDGIGYFSILHPKKTHYIYTRKGNFTTNKNGTIVTQEGFELSPQITLPKDTEDYFIAEDGTFWAKLKSEPQWVELGRITLTRFENPTALKPLKKYPHLFKFSTETGPPEESQPSMFSFGLILGGVLEDLNQPASPKALSPCRLNSTQRKTTQRTLDWAINGPGFFTFISLNSGEIYYSRQAKIQINKTGQLISEHGYVLSQRWSIPALKGLKDPLEQTTFERIDPDGTLWVKYKSGKIIALGQLEIAKVEHPENLRALGLSRPSILLATPNSGQITQVKPGSQGTGKILSGQIENCAEDLLNYPSGFNQIWNQLGYNYPTVLHSKVFHDNQQIHTLTKEKGQFLLDALNQDLFINGEYDLKESQLLLQGIPEGKYNLYLDIDANLDNPERYPGDFTNWYQINIPMKNPQQNMSLLKIMHLTKPVDNNSITEKFDYSCQKGQHHPQLQTFNGPTQFEWDSLGQDVNYEYFVNLYSCHYQFVKTFKAGSTPSTVLKLELPQNQSNQFYTLTIKARKNKDLIGIVTFHGNNHTGWEFPFRVN